MPKTYINIDNPAHGNCGFYAIAIGLIQHLQRELKSGGATPILDRLIGQIIEKYPTQAALVANREEFIARIKVFDTLKYNAQKDERDSRLLDDFNELFRDMLMVYQENEFQPVIVKKYTDEGEAQAQSSASRAARAIQVLKGVNSELAQRSGISTLMDARLLFESYCSGRQASSADLDILIEYERHFPDFLQKIKKMAETWRTLDEGQRWNHTPEAEQEKEAVKAGFFYVNMVHADMVKVESDEDKLASSSQNGQKAEITFKENSPVKNNIVKETEITLEENSPVKKFIVRQREIEQRASILDLSHLSEQLGIQLEVYENRVKVGGGRIDTGDQNHPVVRVNNDTRVGHWTTFLDSDTVDAIDVARLPQAVLINEEVKLGKKPQVTKDSIKNLLSHCVDITHQKEVRNLLAACQDSTKNIDDIMNLYIGYLLEMDGNLLTLLQNEDNFIKICNDLCLNYYGRSLSAITAQRRAIATPPTSVTSEEIIAQLLPYLEQGQAQDHNSPSSSSFFAQPPCSHQQEVSQLIEACFAQKTVGDILSQYIGYLRDIDEDKLSQARKNGDKFIIICDDLCRKYYGKNLPEMVMAGTISCQPPAFETDAPH